MSIDNSPLSLFWYLSMALNVNQWQHLFIDCGLLLYICLIPQLNPTVHPRHYPDSTTARQCQVGWYRGARVIQLPTAEHRECRGCKAKTRAVWDNEARCAFGTLRKGRPEQIAGMENMDGHRESWYQQSSLLNGLHDTYFHSKFSRFLLWHSLC